MKNRKTLLFVLLLVCIIPNIVLSCHSYILKNKFEILADETIKLKNREFDNIMNVVESGTLIKHISKPDDFFKGYFILAFPNDICDVCNIGLFEELSRLENQNNIIVICPNKMRKVLKYNCELYGLSFKQICYRDDYYINNDIFENVVYFFYCSLEGQVLYPLIIRNNLISVKTCMDIIQAIENEV